MRDSNITLISKDYKISMQVYFLQQVYSEYVPTLKLQPYFLKLMPYTLNY